MTQLQKKTLGAAAFTAFSGIGLYFAWKSLPKSMRAWLRLGRAAATAGLAAEFVVALRKSCRGRKPMNRRRRVLKHKSG